MINRILLYNSGGGLGDSIQLFPLILSLKNHFKQSQFFYLGAHENHYENKLKEYNIEIETLNLNLRYFGFRWNHLLRVKKKISNLNIEKFDLIIDLQTKLRNTLVLKMIPAKKFYSATYNFAFSTIKNNYSSIKNISEMTLSNLEKFLNIKIKRISFSLNNIDKIFFDEAKKLLPNNNYIGFSITQGNVYRKKSWPLDNFIELAKKVQIMKKNPVFFIEKKDIELKKKIQKLIPESIFPENESNLSSPALVTCLASRLELAISIDNGVMHMLSLSNVPLISIFGPTDSEKFSPKYKNSISLDSKKLYNTNNISEITVEDVLVAAKQFLNF